MPITKHIKRTVIKFTYPMGSISSSTMRPEDLIPIFLGELRAHLKYNSQHSKSVSNARQQRLFCTTLEQILKGKKSSVRYYAYELDRTPGEDLEALTDYLNEYAGPYFYFGSHPGNGADYGFWLCEDWQETLEDNGGLVVGDFTELDRYLHRKELDGVSEVAMVNDHGNVTLYRLGGNGVLYEVWSVV